MADVSKFSLQGEIINVKDATARSTASNALSTAQGAQSTATAAQEAAQGAQSTAASAQSTATQALNLAQKIEDLSRVEVSYTSGTETITIATGTHEITAEG